MFYPQSTNIGTYKNKSTPIYSCYRKQWLESRIIFIDTFDPTKLF